MTKGELLQEKKHQSDARFLYEAQAAMWPSPIGWENLSDAAKHLWLERAKKKARHD
jgi:hypothetical protein